MKTAFFDYDLPAELIAQNPVSPRDSCRLMVINRKEQTIAGTVFNQLGEFLKPGDVLVFNDSKVIPARVIFMHDGKEVEIFLTKKLGETRWLAIGKPGKILREGAEFNVGAGLNIKIININADGQREIEFFGETDALMEKLKKIGSAPLPPYIKESTSDFADYQTVYAKEEGSVAAPTAGLHFTEKLLENLKERGIKQVFVTLHVGLGTFLPVKSENVEQHLMHSEFYNINEDAADVLNNARKTGARIIAVGTTSVRVLESNCDLTNGFNAGFGETSIYIYPGYSWKCVDGLITNFHLPKSTLLMLTCSFGGSELILRSYKIAVEKKYRFFSFGDAMLII